MQVKGSVRQHAYLMIPQRPSGSALRRDGFGPSTPRPLVGSQAQSVTRAAGLAVCILLFAM
jgi:hypothetical protein